MRLIIVVASLSLFSAIGEAQEWSPSLQGSRASLRRQNEHADREKLERIANDAQLTRLKRAGKLVPIRETFYLKEKQDRLWREKFRWLRPNAATFLDDLAAVYYSLFQTPLQVNSAVRTKVRQQGLLFVGWVNAAPVDGDRASPHITGAAFDISRWDDRKRNLPKDNLEFLCAYLLDMERAGFVEVSREVHQAVFHIMVFDAYPARDLSAVPQMLAADSTPQ